MNNDDEFEKLRVHNHAIKGEGREVGLIEQGHDQSLDNGTGLQEKKKRELENFILADALLNSFMDSMKNWTPEQHRAMAGGFVNWANKQADESQRKAEQAQIQIASRTEFINQAEDVLDDHKSGKQVDAQATRRLLESRNVNITDDMSTIMMLELLRHEIPKAQAENDILEKDAQKLDENAQAFRTEAQNVSDKVKEIEKLPENEQKVAFEEMWENVDASVLREYIVSPDYKLVSELAQNAAQAKLEESKLSAFGAGNENATASYSVFAKPITPLNGSGLVSSGESKLEKLQGKLTTQFTDSASSVDNSRTLENNNDLNQKQGYNPGLF